MFAMKLVATSAASFAGAVALAAFAVAGREIKRSGQGVLDLEASIDSLRVVATGAMPAAGYSTGRSNVITDFNEDLDLPVIDGGAYVDPLASVIGAVRIGRQVYVAPFASIRGDEGQPIYIADGANVQDGVVVHALETHQEGLPVSGRTYRVGNRDYAVYVGRRVSLAHQALVHGPALIEDNVFVGMQAMVFKASVGEGVVIEPGAKVIGVSIPAHRYVPAGQTITDQKVADKLPTITDSYAFRSLNDAVVHVNTSFANGYREAAAERADSAAAAEQARTHGPAPEPSSHAKPEKKEEKKSEGH